MITRTRIRIGTRFAVAAGLLVAVLTAGVVAAAAVPATMSGYQSLASAQQGPQTAANMPPGTDAGPFQATIYEH